MTPKAAGTIRLVIADDHTMFLEGIVRLLEGAGDLEIVGRAVRPAGSLR